MNGLFDSVAINGLSVKNRLVRSATYEAMAEDDGTVNDRLFEVYRKLSDGGIGIIITSGMYVSKEGKGLVGQIGIHNDDMIPGLRKIASIIHDRGSAAIAQICYAGVQSNHNVTENTFNPSGVPDPATGHSGKIMSSEDIKTLQADFVSAAHRAKKAGFDGVQLHIGHGYLLSQFLSPYMNRRADSYGGSVENRIRIATEISECIKKDISGFQVFVKINAVDEFEGGTVLEEGIEACKYLEKAGVDVIEVSGGIVAAGKYNRAAIRTGIISPENEAYFSKEAAAISEAVSIPVISVGGYRSPDVMEKILNQSKIQMISMSRPFLAEPDLVKRWKSGDIKKAKCVSCGKCRAEDGNYCTVFRRGK
jgi:2,4-dienoyl-CoA reductase-like NADH-dependent reductase (Old Yellow Enzyme family)